MTFHLTQNPISVLTENPTIYESSLNLEKGLVAHYRHDLPGSISSEYGFSHHLLTFFLSSNDRQIIYRKSNKIFDGPMKAGDFYLYPAHTISHTQWQSIDKTFHLAIAPSFLARIAEETESTKPGTIELQSIPKQQDRTLTHLVQLFLDEMLTQTPQEMGERLYQESLSTMLGLHLLRRYSTITEKHGEDHSGLSPIQVHKILTYIQDNLADKISLQEMADQIGMSRSYFATQFKNSQGITPHQFVTRERIEKAKNLLRNRQNELSEIALSCGFSSQSHFNRAFKQQVGITPRKYQKSL